MATRFYLPSTGNAAVSPAWSGSWGDTTNASPSKLAAVTSRINSSMVTKTVTDTGNADNHFACGMWVSEPLSAQTIAAQTVDISIRVEETSGLNNEFIHWIVRVVSNDGSTFNGTNIVDYRQDSLEVSPSALTSRHDTLTSNAVTVSTGDRIVIEVGIGGDPTLSNGHQSDLVIGDNSATDLGANDTDTAANNPWVNFANTISFQSGTPSSSPSASPSNSPSNSPSSSPSNSPSSSPSSSPSNSPSSSPSHSPSSSPSSSPSNSPSSSPSSSPSNSPSSSPSNSPSSSPSSSPSNSPSSSPSNSPSNSPSSSPSDSPSSSPSSSPSASPSPSGGESDIDLIIDLGGGIGYLV